MDKRIGALFPILKDIEKDLAEVKALLKKREPSSLPIKDSSLACCQDQSLEEIGAEGSETTEAESLDS
jgi:hypothetical protein